MNQVFFYFKKISKRFFRKRFVWSGLVALIIIILLLGIGVSLSNRSVGKSSFNIKLFSLVRTIRKTTDILFLPYYFKKDNLPVYYLSIDDKDYKKLNSNLPAPYSDQILTDEYKKTVPAILNYQDQVYQVKVRYRGENSSHWSAHKKSWRINLDGDNLIDGMSELNLILPFDRYYIVEQWNNLRAINMGLWLPKSRLVKLVVNGHPMGVYWETEGWNKEMLEKNERSGDSNLYQTREGYDDKPYYQQVVYWDKYTKDQITDFNNYTEFSKLLDVLNSSSEEFNQQVSALIDMDNFYQWQIHSILVGSPHQFGDNLRLYFNNTLGKFEFVPWDVGSDEPALQVDKCANQFFAKIFNNPEFVFARNKLLWDYVKDNSHLDKDLELYDQLWDEYKAAFYKDRQKIKSNLQVIKTIKDKRELYIKNYQTIQQVFRNARLDYYFGKLDDNTMSLSLLVDTFGAIQVNKININSSTQTQFILIEDSNNNGAPDSEDKILDPFNLNLILTSDRLVEGIPHPITVKPKIYKYFIKAPAADIIDLHIEAINYFTQEQIL